MGALGFTTTLTNFGNFTKLKSIGGDFSIVNNAALTRIDADNFPALVSVERNISLESNHLLSTIAGFPAVKRIGGSLVIRTHDALTTIGDFPALTSIGSSLIIGGDPGEENDILTAVGDFPALKTIVGDVRILNNPELANIGDFTSLVSVGEDFRILYHPELTDMGNYPALTSIGGDFLIGSIAGTSGNGPLTTLGDFSALNTIGGIISIQNNSALADCCSLPARVLNYVGEAGREVTLSDNAAGCTTGTYPAADTDICVTDHFILNTQAKATAFPDALTRIDNGNVVISGDVNDLSALSGVTKIDNLIVRKATALDELSKITTAATSTTPAVYGGLSGLVEVNNLIVGAGTSRNNGNTALDSLGYFPSLTHIGYLNVAFNHALTTLGTFEVLEDVSGSISVRANDALTDLGEYPALENINGNLSIEQSNALTNHGNFPVLDKINSQLVINRNPLLTALTFPKLKAVNQRILIIDNETLSDCCGLSAEAIGTSSNVVIARNAAGCQSIAGATDIAAISPTAACIVGNVTFRTQADVNAFPASITTLRGGVFIGPDANAGPHYKPKCIGSINGNRAFNRQRDCLT